MVVGSGALREMTFDAVQGLEELLHRRLIGFLRAVNQISEDSTVSDRVSSHVAKPDLYTPLLMSL